MRKVTCFIVLFTICSIFLLTTGCPPAEEPPSPEEGSKITITTGNVTFDLYRVPAGKYFVGSNPPGDNNVSITKDYFIGETEVTYKLWYEVKNWALSKNYTFSNPGREGHDGRDGGAPSDTKNEPVTNINWRDCMVWCNALSEKQGRKPCYYADDSLINPIRTVTDIEELDLMPGGQDNPYVDMDANGFRLPAEVEWEIAARGAALAVTQGSYGTLYAGSNAIDTVAWYSGNAYNVGEGHEDYGTHDVGTKESNELGLFDMSGNVWEWCWDWYGGAYPSGDEDPIGPAKGSYRVGRSGSWANTAQECTVDSLSYVSPYYGFLVAGFRLVMAAE